MGASTTPQPFVRPLRPSTDRDSIIHITAAPSLCHEPAVSIVPYIWAVPYTLLTPEYSFVLDVGDGTGTAVGYILGTPSNKEFAARYRQEYIPVLSRYGYTPPDLNTTASWDEDLPGTLRQILYSPEAELLHSDFPDLLKEYPAHLHIDILPEYQRMGFGKNLMEAFCEKLRHDEVGGVHLIMAGDNVEAEKFYGKVGFRRFPMILDGGASKEQGRHSNTSIWLVRKLV